VEIREGFSPYSLSGKGRIKMVFSPSKSAIIKDTQLWKEKKQADGRK
jgi:hypothetical protein